MPHRLAVLVATPAHSSITGPLSYRSELPLAPGTLVRVPFGRREVLGLVWDSEDPPGDERLEMQDKSILGALEGIAPLPQKWRQLVTFSANYYQRGVGEVALAALPPQLRGLTAVQLARRLRRKSADNNAAAPDAVTDVTKTVALSPEQAQALGQIAANPGPFLVYGATGSGKTEVYLQAVQALLTSSPQAQALVMVPEINLTPQLESRFIARFGSDAVVSLHSGMTNPQRLKSWLAAHTGAARIVLGTRMAVFASMPALGLIVVDEEHDPSYKQQEGARYSARDLAVYRGKLEGAKVLLGSATPSLESWQASEKGRYQRLAMPSRIGDGRLPAVKLVDMNLQPKKTVFSVQLLEAVRQRLARGEQSLVFLNRRGYAPVLACNACDWKSECPHCSAFRVFHKIDRTLRCHHCGFTERVPRACPECGNVDIAPLGRGTERLEEHLAELLADTRNAQGEPVRIARMDADTTRLKGSLESQLAQVHAGAVDVLVGTQMITKGHDFPSHHAGGIRSRPMRRLFSSDFRALRSGCSALLMQAAGRAGTGGHPHRRPAKCGSRPGIPPMGCLAALKKPRLSGVSPRNNCQGAPSGRHAALLVHQALVRAEARSQEAAQAFLNAASAVRAHRPPRRTIR